MLQQRIQLCKSNKNIRKKIIFTTVYYWNSFDAIFQLANTTQTTVWPAISVTLGNSTVWIGTLATNVTTISYNVTVRIKIPFVFCFHLLFKITFCL